MIIDNTSIENIKKNLFYRSINSINDYNNFDWHKDKNNNIDTCQVNSSQALAVDFWGCLKLSKYKNQLINMLFDKNEPDWNIDFEYVDKTLLLEKKSTQIDILIKSKNIVLFIESKFTEKDGGGCSQINKTENGIYQCNGKYEEQINSINNIKSKCALTGKGIKYWNFIDELTNYSKEKEYNPCPFKKGEYQWMRNICFAEAYSIKNKNKSECYLVYLKSDKCAISKKVENETYLGTLKGNIKDENAFKPITYKDLISRCISFLEKDLEEKNIWLDLDKWISTKEQMIK